MIPSQSPSDSSDPTQIPSRDDAHSPVKEIKISFHDANAMRPKPLPPLKDSNAGAGGSMVQEPKPQSQLDPLKEVLFKSWAMAQGIQDPDAPDNHADLRGMYNKTNGQIHPPGTLTGHQDTINRVMSAPPTQPMMPPQGGLQAPPMGGLQGPPQGAIQPIPNAQPVANPMSQAGPIPNSSPDGSGEPIQQLLAMLRSQGR